MKGENMISPAPNQPGLCCRCQGLLIIYIEVCTYMKHMRGLHDKAAEKQK